MTTIIINTEHCHIYIRSFLLAAKKNSPFHSLCSDGGIRQRRILVFLERRVIQGRYTNTSLRPPNIVPAPPYTHRMDTKSLPVANTSRMRMNIVLLCEDLNISVTVDITSKHYFHCASLPRN